ncbi:MAG: hypothetical protein ACRC7G_08445, partial [Beijerinckiaceae bacterium]
MNIINQIKGQMLAELIAALGAATPAGKQGSAPAGGPPAATLPAALTNLAAGQTVTATALPPDADGAPLVAIAGQALRADTLGLPFPPEARRPGATLTLLVVAGGDAPKLRLIGTQPPQMVGQGTPTQSTFAQANSARTASPVASTPKSEAPDAQVPKVQIPEVQASKGQAPEALAREVVRQLGVAAAIRQGSAAPLYADLAALEARTDQPLPALKPLVAALLAGRLDGEQPLTPDALKTAVAQATGQTAAIDPTRLDARALLTLLRDTARAIAPPAPPRDDQPPPPERDAAPMAARPALPVLAADAPPEMIAAELGRRAEQALDRHG